MESDVSFVKQIICHIWHTNCTVVVDFHILLPPSLHPHRFYPSLQSPSCYNILAYHNNFTTTTTIIIITPTHTKCSTESHHTSDTLIGQVSAYADVTSSGIIPFSRFLNWSGYLHTGQFASLMDSSYYDGHSLYRSMPRKGLLLAGERERESTK